MKFIVRKVEVIEVEAQTASEAEKKINEGKLLDQQILVIASEG